MLQAYLPDNIIKLSVAKLFDEGGDDVLLHDYANKTLRLGPGYSLLDENGDPIGSGGGGSAALTDTYVGYGSAGNVLTGADRLRWVDLDTYGPQLTIRSESNMDYSGYNAIALTQDTFLLEPNHIYASISPNDIVDSGGFLLTGLSTKDVPTFFMNGQMLSDTVNPANPVIYFNAYMPNTDGGTGATLFAVDNDFVHNGPAGQFPLALFEKHGAFAGGTPDSVAFLGVNTPVAGPSAVLHAVNPVTFNDDAPKNYVVAEIEGRPDQVANLLDMKLTGGSSLFSVDPVGGTTIASLAGVGSRPVFADANGKLSA